jgi:tRNA-splicing ligase RtcB
MPALPGGVQIPGPLLKFSLLRFAKEVTMTLRTFGSQDAQSFPETEPLSPVGVNDPKLRLTLPWEEIEESAQEQIAEALRNPYLQTLVVLPDVHWGMNVCIGTVALMRDIIIPSFVGVDIGCGMIHANTHRSAEDLGLTTYDAKKELFRQIQKVIPHGKGSGNKGHAPNYPVHFESALLNGKMQKQVNRRAQHDWGTLGGGNHFIEIGVNAGGEVGLTLHSGSRSPGYNIADYYCRLAGERNPCAAPYFEMASDMGQAYYHDMMWALDFAMSNRWRMLEKLIALFGLGLNEVGTVEKTHNHAVHDPANNTVLHRKGATPANRDEYGIIPGSQLSGVYVVRGLGNERYLCSSSHGAGRTMSRRDALSFDSNEKFKELMADVVCRTDAAVQDEAPWAYKDIHAVVQNQVENGQVEVIDYFKPIIVVKG